MLSMDNVLAWGVEGTTALATLPKYDTWRKGEKLKILLVGYNGKRNTGADVRVVEIVKQFNKVLGPDRIQITVPTLDPSMTEVYFDDSTRLSRLNSIFFKDVLDLCSDNHIAVISEGSTLKSQFANALTLYFCEAAGVMKRQGKPCLAYGSEAGRMDPFLKKIAAEMCSDTYFIMRSEASLKIIEEMGLEGRIGADTAWTFPPAEKSWVTRELKEKSGWDGKKPLLGIAVIDPWSYPVKPNVTKTVKSALTRNWENHYEKFYFFTASERDGKYPAYINGIAEAVNRFKKEHDVHVVVVGMDATDYDACGDLAAALGTKPAIFSSRFYDGYQMTGILHSLSMLVTSRYHARVLSMTGGVPSIAVSLDERLYNILDECGHLDDYYLRTDDPALGEKLEPMMEKLWTKREKVSGEIVAALPRYLKQVADMGKFFRGYVVEKFGGIELGPEPTDWLGYIPDLYEGLRAAIDKPGKKSKGKSKGKGEAK
jgi:polysaccharide pyruvyl transferase WcaK-like protein